MSEVQSIQQPEEMKQESKQIESKQNLLEEGSLGLEGIPTKEFNDFGLQDQEQQTPMINQNAQQDETNQKVFQSSQLQKNEENIPSGLQENQEAVAQNIKQTQNDLSNQQSTSQQEQKEQEELSKNINQEKVQEQNNQTPTNSQLAPQKQPDDTQQQSNLISQNQEVLEEKPEIQDKQPISSQQESRNPILQRETRNTNQTNFSILTQQNQDNQEVIPQPMSGSSILQRSVNVNNQGILQRKIQNTPTQQALQQQMQISQNQTRNSQQTQENTSGRTFQFLQNQLEEDNYNQQQNQGMLALAQQYYSQKKEMLNISKRQNSSINSQKKNQLFQTFKGDSSQFNSQGLVRSQQINNQNSVVTRKQDFQQIQQMNQIQQNWQKQLESLKEQLKTQIQSYQNISFEKANLDLCVEQNTLNLQEFTFALNEQMKIHFNLDLKQNILQACAQTQNSYEKRLTSLISVLYIMLGKIQQVENQEQLNQKTTQKSLKQIVKENQELNQSPYELQDKLKLQNQNKALQNKIFYLEQKIKFIEENYMENYQMRQSMYNHFEGQFQENIQAMGPKDKNYIYYTQ